MDDKIKIFRTDAPKVPDFSSESNPFHNIIYFLNAVQKVINQRAESKIVGRK